MSYNFDKLGSLIFLLNILFNLAIVKSVLYIKIKNSEGDIEMTSTANEVDSNEEFKKIVADYQKYPSQFKSIIIATTSLEGNPDASSVPFLMDADLNFYVLVSFLTTHANNLKATGKGSILFVEDEAKTENIFARKRLSYDCSSVIIDRTSKEWIPIIDKFQERFGKIIEVLRNLQDFNLFKLTPLSGRFVIGFGKAYKIEGDNLNNLIPFQKKSERS